MLNEQGKVIDVLSFRFRPKADHVSGFERIRQRPKSFHRERIKLS